MTGTLRHILVALLALLAVSGCGYSVKKSTVTSVRIGDIENMTSQARLDDMLSDALAAALLKNGIEVRNNSEHSIEGTLKTLSLYQLSEREELATTYRVNIEGEFFLVGAEGERTRLPGGGKYIVTFSSEGSLTPVIANKELAIGRAVEDLAEEISASILYRR